MKRLFLVVSAGFWSAAVVGRRASALGARARRRKFGPLFAGDATLLRSFAWRGGASSGAKLRPGVSIDRSVSSRIEEHLRHRVVLVTEALRRNLVAPGASPPPRAVAAARAAHSAASGVASVVSARRVRHARRLAQSVVLPVIRTGVVWTTTPRHLPALAARGYPGAAQELIAARLRVASARRPFVPAIHQRREQQSVAFSTARALAQRTSLELPAFRRREVPRAAPVQSVLGASSWAARTPSSAVAAPDPIPVRSWHTHDIERLRQAARVRARQPEARPVDGLLRVAARELPGASRGIVSRPALLRSPHTHGRFPAPAPVSVTHSSDTPPFSSPARLVVRQSPTPNNDRLTVVRRPDKVVAAARLGETMTREIESLVERRLVERVQTTVARELSTESAYSLRLRESIHERIYDGLVLERERLSGG